MNLSQFSDKELAAEVERRAFAKKLAEKSGESFEKYTHTYNYKQLINKLDVVGIWKVTGEDPNCDLGGTHYMPLLGYFHGKLRDVIKKAVVMPGFWQWGAGGDFQQVEITEVK